MTKTIFKSLFVLLAFLAISSCERNEDYKPDDPAEDITSASSLEFPVEESTTKGVSNKKSGNCQISISVAGAYTWITVDGRTYRNPHVGSYVTCKSFCGKGRWETTADGGLEIVGSATGSTVRALRKKSGGTSLLFFPNAGGFITIYFRKVPAPIPAHCPNKTHTNMSFTQGSGNTTVVKATNYNSKFHYAWKIEVNGLKINRTGRSAVIPPLKRNQSAMVTLTVSGPSGCYPQSATREYE